MGRTDLIPAEGNFYKANLHCHTTYSDGMLTPQQVKELYMERGYSIVAFTDHNRYVYHKELSEERFLPLAGYEVNNDGRKGEGGHPIADHLCALALDPERAQMVERPVVYDSEKINEMIQRLREAGFIVNYNHPAWSLEHTEDFLALHGITCFEVFNYGAEVSTGAGYGDQQYDLWVKSGRRAFPIATDDNHNPPVYETGGGPGPDFDSCGGFTMIKARELTYRAVTDAICAGHLYASNGPLIEGIYLENDRLVIDCGPVCSVMMKDCGINNAWAIYDGADSITHAEIPLSAVRREFGGAVRAVLMRKDGKRAWTNAWDLDEMGF